MAGRMVAWRNIEPKFWTQEVCHVDFTHDDCGRDSVMVFTKEVPTGEQVNGQMCYEPLKPLVMGDSPGVPNLFATKDAFFTGDYHARTSAYVEIDSFVKFARVVLVLSVRATSEISHYGWGYICDFYFNDGEGIVTPLY